MKTVEEASGSKGSCAVVNSSKALKSSKFKNSSPPNSASDSENDHSETEKTEAISGQNCNSDSGEEQISGNELSRQDQQKENSAKSGENNSNQENSVSVNSTFDITHDDEIYTLECPQNYNKQGLFNIDFGNLKSVTSKGGVFKLHLLNSDKKFITLAVPKSATSASLVKLPLTGHIVIQKCVNVPNGGSIVEDDCDKDRVIFPDDIKVRHPLLGTDWKAHAELASAAFTRHSHSKKNKISKKEKVKYLEITDIDEVETKKIKRESDAEIVPHKRKKFE